MDVTPPQSRAALRPDHSSGAPRHRAAHRRPKSNKTPVGAWGGLRRLLGDRYTTAHDKAYNIVDLYSTFDEVPATPHLLLESTDVAGDSTAIGNVCNRCKVLAKRVTPCYWILLVLIGVATALVSFLMDYLVSILMPIRNGLVDQQSHVHLALFAITCACIATFCCHIIAPAAVGSGIPEVKTVLSGVMIPDFLSFRTGVAKVIGLISAMAGDLYVGKEGPFVHISSVIANVLSRCSCFRGCVATPTGAYSLLAAAVSAGVTATFGAPVGGVLFSIEV
eukprot:Selendium_serpulae@DN7102_c0_g1_i1.p1